MATITKAPLLDETGQSIVNAIEGLNNHPIPPGGNENDVLKKASGTSYDVEWGSSNAEWGNISGTLANQADLQSALNSKQAQLSVGNNISIRANVISAVDTVYRAGDGISITMDSEGNNIISTNGITGVNWGDISGTLSNQSDLQLALNGKQNNLTSQTAYTNKGTATKVAQITTNSLGQVTNINEVDIAKTTLSDLGITATVNELNTLDGITATTAELNYTDGVTSNIQTQLNNKQASITSSAKLGADLVDDSSATNKFVTASEKTSIGTALQPNDNITQLNNNAGYITSSYHDSTKQDTLIGTQITGQNIKTINGNSILGSGNLVLGGITYEEV